MKRSLILAILLSFALYSVAVVNANAGQVTLQWNANTEPDLAGYRVHYGTSSRSYQYSTDVKNSTSCTISGLNTGTTYYFAVTAYDTHQNESRYSDEVDHYVPADSGSTADPIPATDPIVDNGDAGSSYLGSWKVSSGKNPHGGSSLYSQTPATEYVFETALNGLSDVQLWWTVTGNRCSRVPVEIYDGNTLLDVVEINQQIDGGRWNTLGTYAFGGTARVVILSESSSCSTCADAVNFVPADSGSTVDPIPATDPIVDNGDAGSSYLGSWKVSSGKNPHGGSSLYSQTPGTEYVFKTALNGLGEVQLWWTVTGNRCSRVPVEIYDGNTLLDVVEINQQIDGGRWNTLGTYAFSGTAQVVILSESSSCSTCADAVNFVPADSGSTVDPIPATDPIVDNGDAGSSYLGSWKVSGGKNPYGSSSLYSQTPATEYVFETALNGLGDVQLWWTVTGNRCSRVPVEIYDGNTLLDVVEINQQIDGGRWNTLGTYAFGGTARVVIQSESSSCSTCADALRLLP